MDIVGIIVQVSVNIIFRTLELIFEAFRAKGY
jgi:hypothetical protein